jgi:hypothetical protein
MIESLARAVAAAGLMLALAAPPHAFADTARSGKRPPASGAMTSAPMKVNGSGVGLRYRVEGAPRAGVPVPIALSFGGVTDPAGALLRFEGEGLSLGNGVAASQNLPTGGADFTIEVTPAGEGAAYLHVFTTQRGATSAASILIQVGKEPAALPKASGLKPSGDGEKIHAMPVQ